MITEQQRQERKNGIFASDVAAILGKSQYKTALEVWLEKTGRKELDDLSEKAAIKWGNYLEAPIIQAFEEERKLKTRIVPDSLYHMEHPFLGCHLDALVIDGECIPRAVLEVKTAGAFTSHKWDDEIPVEYLLQITMQMAITNLPKAYVATLIGGQDFRVFEFNRDKNLEDRVIEKLKKFHVEHILADVPPVITTERDTLLLYPDSHEGEVIADEELLIALDGYRHVKEQVDELEKQKKAYRDKIVSAIGVKDRLVDAHGNIVATYRTTSPSIKFNEKEFARQNEAVYLAYMKEVPGHRRFLPKEIKR